MLTKNELRAITSAPLSRPQEPVSPERLVALCDRHGIEGRNRDRILSGAMALQLGSRAFVLADGEEPASDTTMAPPAARRATAPAPAPAKDLGDKVADAMNLPLPKSANSAPPAPAAPAPATKHATPACTDVPSRSHHLGYVTY